MEMVNSATEVLLTPAFQPSATPCLCNAAGSMWSSPAEHAATALRFFNVEPGFVMTEAMHLNDPDGELSKRQAGAPPAAPAAVIAWLATHPDADKWKGQTVSAQPLCLELELIPDWRA